jgi:transposase
VRKILHDKGYKYAASKKKVFRNSFPYCMISPEYPSYSPDLNPIENIWGWLKDRVNRDMPQTIEKLKESIKKHWNSVNEDFLAPYDNSMPERMDSLIEKDGNKINY